MRNRKLLPFVLPIAGAAILLAAAVALLWQQNATRLPPAPSPTSPSREVPPQGPTETPTPVATPTPTPVATATPIPTPPPTAQPTPTPTPVHLPEINRGNTSRKRVIFTFDAGAGTRSLDPILIALKKHDVQATFFLTGKWAEQNPEHTKRIAREGHEIFNHTYSHPYLTKVSDATIRSELQQAENVISGLTGKTTKPYFRTPYGDRNGHVWEVAGTEGYQSVFWTVDALDWKEGSTAESVKQRIYDRVVPGAIILMHIGDELTGHVLDEVITELERQGYAINPLTKGL